MFIVFKYLNIEKKAFRLVTQLPTDQVFYLSQTTTSLANLSPDLALSIYRASPHQFSEAHTDSLDYG